MPRPAKITLSCLLALTAWAGLIVVADLVGERLRYGQVFTESLTSIAVDAGDRFSISLPDRGASVGDYWTATVETPGVLVQLGERLVPGHVALPFSELPVGGGGGTRYFTFEADHAGTTTISFFNCFQGCHPGRTSTASRTVGWTVSVR